MLHKSFVFTGIEWCIPYLWPLPRWEQGFVTVVEAADGEPHWAINIKKGIINLWQVNLGQRGLISPSGLDSHLDSAFMGRDSPAMNVFKVMEVRR